MLDTGSYALALLADRFIYAAQGYAGGLSGAKAAFWSSANGSTLNPKLTLFLPARARVRLDLPGGGGYANPLDRDCSRLQWTSGRAWLAGQPRSETMVGPSP